MVATRTVEETAQEADKVFTLNPWIYSCLFPFSFISVHSQKIFPFFLCINLKFF